MHIAMIGAGYVGLVSGACFSDFGHHVVCVDSDEDRIAALVAGCAPTTAVVDGRSMRRLEMDFVGQPFVVRSAFGDLWAGDFGGSTIKRIRP